MIIYDKTKHIANTSREYAKSTITSEVWWVAESDRWIFVEWNTDNEIVNINFNQGNDKYSRDAVEAKNKRLTVFINNTIDNLFEYLKGEDIDLNLLDKLCWLYHESSCIIQMDYDDLEDYDRP